MENSRLERTAGIAILLLLLLTGSFLVMQPFLSALAWAAVMTFSLWPLQRRLITRLKERRTMAALISTSTIALVLLVPTVVIVMNLTGDASAIAGATKRWMASPPSPPAWLQKVPVVGNRAATYWQELANDSKELFRHPPNSPEQELTTPTTRVADPSTVPSTQPLAQTKLAQALRAVIAWGRTWLPVAGLLVVNGVTQILLSVFLTFFLFRDGEALANRLGVMIARVAGEKGSRLLDVAGSTVRGVVYGILGTALVQGALAAFGCFIAGVPGAALLGLITFLLSPVPLGPPLVWLPAMFWLFHQGATGWGIFMLVWGLIVSSIDNVLKPLIISQGSATPFILILFGVIGGAVAFGFIGVFLGPTVLAVAYRLVEDWSRPPETSDLR